MLSDVVLDVPAATCGAAVDFPLAVLLPPVAAAAESFKVILLAVEAEDRLALLLF